MKFRFLFSLMALFVMTLSAQSSWAQTAVCDGLKGEQRTLALSIMASEHPYECCDDTIAECLKRKKVCRQAKRLADLICRSVAAKKTEEAIRREIEHRAVSATNAKREIDLKGFPVAGDENAGITIVVYACARCPYCSHILPQLYKSVTEGALKGVAKLYLKPFPIRSHANSRVGGMAWMLGIEEKRFWPVVLEMYKKEIYDNFEPSRLLKLKAWGELPEDTITKGLKKQALADGLEASKKEGLKFRVDATPTVFVGYRKYLGSLDIQSIEDYVFEVKEGATTE